MFTKLGEKEFVCEHSTIIGNNATCPYCNRPDWLDRRQSQMVRKERDKEGDITAWVVIHRCGATIHILND